MKHQNCSLVPNIFHRARRRCFRLTVFAGLALGGFVLPLSAADSFVETFSHKNLPGIYHDGWIDFNKNGREDVFEDPGQPLDKRVEDLLSQMTVAEKTCQLATLYGYGRVLNDPLPTPEWKNEIWKDGIANIDEMHNGVGPSGNPDNPYIATPAATVGALNEVQRWFIEDTRLGIPAEFTDEGIRGLSYRKSTDFPADIGLGASWDRDLVTQVGGVVAREARSIGYRNVYAPILDIARDPRWGRGGIVTAKILIWSANWASA